MNPKQRKSLLCTVCAFVLFAAYGGEWQLTRDGKSNARIVVSDPKNASEIMALREMSLFTTQIAGCSFEGGEYTIRLARAEDAPPEMKEKLNKAKSKDAVYLKTIGKELVISGKTPRAELYGVYVFLEKYLGCRWFYPGEAGTYTPKTQNIEIPDNIDYFHEPSFPFRTLCLVFAVYGEKGWRDTKLWMVRNRMDIGTHGGTGKEYPELNDAVNSIGAGGGGHEIWWRAVPYKKYFSTHPEYFCLYHGERIGEGQRCLSNPDVKKLLIESMKKHFTEKSKWPGRPVFSMGMTDDDRWCECENCIKAGTYNGKFYTSLAMHKLYSEASAEVLKQIPSAEFWVDFYISARTPPPDPALQYDRSIMGTYNAHQSCCAHALADPECKLNEKIYNEMKEWSKHGPKMNFRGYYSVNNCYYAPMEMTVAQDLKQMLKDGLDGGWWDEVATPGCDTYFIKEDTDYKDSMLTCWPYFYMAAKILWNADDDPKELIRDAFTKYYGKAAAPMIAARDFKQELWDNAPGHCYYNGPFRLGYCLAVPGAEKKFDELFAEAEKLASGDPSLLAKIAMDRRHLQKWGIEKAKILKKANSGKNEIPLRAKSGEIVIDGVLNESDWKKAESITEFKKISDQTNPTEETRVKVLFDRTHFYIAMEAMTEKAWSPLKTHYTVPDESKVCLDDSVEFFIMPPDSVDSYCHWIVNSIGTIYDAKHGDGVADVKFNTAGKIAVKKEKDRYIVEAVIPVSDFNKELILPGVAWKMHFVRGCTNLQPPATEEGLALDGFRPHDYQNWRKAVPGVQVLPNGTFGILGPRPKHSKSVSEKYPAGWGGAKASVLPDGKLEISFDGHIGRYMTLPADEKKYRLTVELRVVGKGKVRIETSTNCGKDRKGGGKTKKWHILTGEPQILQFTKDILPYEEGYFFFFSQTEHKVIVESITGSVTEITDHQK